MDEQDRRAWAYLSRVAEPPNPLLAELIRRIGPVEAADRVARGALDSDRLLRSTAARRELDCAQRDLEILDRLGGRLVVAGDQEWPGFAFAGFDHLDKKERPQAHPPTVLWVVGPASLVDVAERSAALVGTRAASAYGEYVAGDLAVGLAERDVAVVSGGAYGIDGAAHRAALAAEGLTVAVLACGIDVAYPSGHSALLHRVSRHGLLVSEYPPGVRPTRRQFLSRNRLVAALSRATVVVEAGVRSGAANTAGWADALGRPVGAVPGPVTSASSVGCHALIASRRALVITRAADIVELAGRMGETAPELERPGTEIDELDDTELSVYEALPRRGSRTIDEIAVTAGLPVTDVLAPLTMLDVRGLVVQADGRWKLAKR
ncbi:MAG: DNA-processing protein DprA [Actinomycetota bacterium]|nr:DNA-processing protein DprA [Actinomycetota bacterium]